MQVSIQTISILISVLIILLVVHLIRVRKLREDYSLLWLLASGVLLLFSVDRGFIDRAAIFFGVAYPPSLLLLGAILAGLTLAMHFSVALSRLSEESKRLAQVVALLEVELGHTRAEHSIDRVPDP